MKMMQLSPIRLQGMLVGLCVVFVIYSYFAESRALLISTAAALGIVLVMRLINPRSHPPAIGFALSCLLGAISANIAWKNHWGGVIIFVFAACPVLVGLVKLVKTSRAGGPGLTNPK
jgi:uncharacterized membrane protein HdeD (DUF308 family)